MARQEIHSEDLKIEQKAPILDYAKHEGDIVLADGILNKDYADALAFNEEPVTIRLKPSAEKNAPSSYPVWVNGKGCEVFQNGRWEEIGYLPVGRELIIKRKYVEVIIRAKTDTVHTQVMDPDGDNPRNVIDRYTSAVHSFDIVEDRNPKGRAWAADLYRRNM